MNSTPNARGTEEQLSEALEALAGQLHPAPDAFRTARGGWLRRERRRRLVLTVLITVVFALAVLIGLWVLNQAPPGSSAIFSHGHNPTAMVSAEPFGIT
ncbi:hypothetical protein [Streptomyces sp. NPDC018833]|uniref:hypothetical protein n=1 Tax=Streptomyces sp. NPDC018833 TaxID=3365053 RepID=UPI0037890C5F